MSNLSEESRLQLSGPDQETLQLALLDAFDLPALKQMVKYGLNEDLDRIAARGNLEQVIFDLIQWADRQDRERDLITAASNAVPGNALMKTTAEELLSKNKPVDESTLPQEATRTEYNSLRFSDRLKKACSKRKVVCFAVVAFVAAIMLALVFTGPWLRIFLTKDRSTSELCSKMLEASRDNSPDNQSTLTASLSITGTLPSDSSIFSLDKASRDMVTKHRDPVYDWRIGGTMVICARNYDAVLIKPRLPEDFHAFVQYRLDDPSMKFSVGLYKAGDPANNFSVSVSSKSIFFFPAPTGATTRGTISYDAPLVAQSNITSDLYVERKDGVLTISSNGRQFTFSEDERLDQYNYLFLTAGSTHDTSKYRFPGIVVVEDLVITSD